jgi:arsenite methyltransferase
MTDYLEKTIDYTRPEVANVLDELSLWAARFGTVLLDNIPLKPDMQILDVGFGTGFPLFELAQMAGSQSRVVGLEVWEAGLERAKAKQAIYNLPNVELKLYDGANFPLPDNSFDLIVSNLGINNFENPAAILAECARVAKPGGILALTTNPEGHFSQFYEVFRELLQEIDETGAKGYLARLESHEKHRMDGEQLFYMLCDAGFMLNENSYTSFTMRFANGSALLEHFFIGLGFLDGWREVLATDAATEKLIFGELEKRLNDLARNRGELRLSVPVLYVEAEKST